MKLKVGTRGSALALRQASLVAEALVRADTSIECELVPISTRGDQRRDVPISSLGDGAFVKAIEQALCEGDVDIAVHSAKDVPVDGEPEDLLLAAFPPRADPRDVVITRSGEALAELPAGALVGTGSPRRMAQTLALRPDLVCVGIRGNVDTRLRRLGQGDVDAIVIAAAGLERLGRLAEATEVLETNVMTPAAGQGALAVQCRSDDSGARSALAAIDDAACRAEVLAERAVLRRLGGGCQVPVGASARWRLETLVLRAVLASPNGRRLFVEQASGNPCQAEALGWEVGGRLTLAAADLLAGVPRV